MQSEVNICSEASYVDFVVWTESDIHIEKILPDQEFWLDIVGKTTKFYKTCLLPDLVGKFYTWSICPLRDSPQEKENTPIPGIDNAQDTERASSSVEKWCYCRGDEEEGRPMVHCDNGYCRIVWFHFDCLGIDKVPSGSWYCPDPMAQTAGNLTNLNKKKKLLIYQSELTHWNTSTHPITQSCLCYSANFRHIDFMVFSILISCCYS